MERVLRPAVPTAGPRNSVVYICTNAGPEHDWLLDTSQAIARSAQGGSGLRRTWEIAAGVVALGLLGTAAFLWLSESRPPVAPPAAASPLVEAAPPAAAPATEPVVRYPVDPIPAAQEVTASLDPEAALTELFGRKAVLSMFQLQDFPRRFVATVDNLGRSHAPVGLWPVNPTGGRFIVEKQNSADVISADNGLRYTPYVLLIETVDLRRVVAVYRRLYPLLQKAYEDIGYPKSYFNDRLVDVIDELLATPDITGPQGVYLPTINGPIQPERPWVLYEFDDPALQSLSAGQRILLRMGPVNERRMKTKLAEVRRLVTAGDLPR